jgi:hypothetical protein
MAWLTLVPGSFSSLLVAVSARKLNGASLAGLNSSQVVAINIADGVLTMFTKRQLEVRITEKPRQFLSTKFGWRLILLWPFSETTAAAMRVFDAAQPSIAVATFTV